MTNTPARFYKEYLLHRKNKKKIINFVFLFINQNVYNKDVTVDIWYLLRSALELMNPEDWSLWSYPHLSPKIDKNAKMVRERDTAF